MHSKITWERTRAIVMVTNPILAPAASFYGYAKTFVFKPVKKQH